METEILFAIILFLLFLGIIFYFLFRHKVTSEVTKELKTAEMDIKDIEKKVKPLDEARSEAIEPHVEKFRKRMDDLKARIIKLEHDREMCLEHSRAFIQRVNAGQITPETFTREALKLNAKYKQILKADFKTVEGVVKNIKLEIVELEKEISVFLPGQDAMRSILLDLQDIVRRCDKLEKFFVKEISEVHIE